MDKLDSVSHQGTNCNYNFNGFFSSICGWSNIWIKILSSKSEFSRERDSEERDLEAEEADLAVINVFISRDQVNIALLKKFKTVDVPAQTPRLGMYRKHYRSPWDSVA